VIYVLKTIRTCIIAFVFIGAVFCAGCFWGQRNTGKSGTDTVDTSGVDRIIAIARSGLIAERADIERQRRGLDEERRRINEERAIDKRERERIITERKGYADIERLCKDTIRIIEDREKEK
jgi:hypothetical protein